jgi:hypothetical protein
MKSYWYITAPALLSFLIGLGLWLIGLRWVVYPQGIWLLIFFEIVAYTNKKILDLGLSDDRIKFQNYYSLTIFVRLILSLIFLFMLIFLKVANIKTLITNFILLYFFFLIFEIYYLFANLRPDSK